MTVKGMGECSVGLGVFTLTLEQGSKILLFFYSFIEIFLTYDIV